MNDKDCARLKIMLELCNEVKASLVKHDYVYQEYLDDHEFYNSINMDVFQIGELASKLSDGYKEKTIEQMPWHQITSMRNIIGHDYGNVDETIVWQTATESIPELQNFLVTELEKS
ncbi:MAG: DUF86 domain-containing protein [Coriobacteriia bacterium]|nr:DUF86 domain-containing protein [Coriobacteriia bacterium]